MGEGTPDYQIGSGFEPCLWSFGRSRRPFQTDQNHRDDSRWKMLPLEKTLDTGVKGCQKMCDSGCNLHVFFVDCIIFQGSVSAGVGFVGSSGPQGWQIWHHWGFAYGLACTRKTAMKHV